MEPPLNLPLEDLKEDFENHQDSDRFNKRLNLYRIHQNECKLRVDQSFDEINEQHNHEIVELQKKSKEGKQKRVNKRGMKKQIEINKTKQMLMTEAENFLKTQQTPQILNIKQEFPLDIDLEDIDLKSIETLVKTVDQPLTPEVLNFDDMPQYPTPYQLFQQFASSSNGLQNYPPAYFYNPNWMS